jgi:hypothetical protein
MYSSITPLPNHKRIQYVKELLQDAVEQGATIYTGGDIIGSPDSMLVRFGLEFDCILKSNLDQLWLLPNTRAWKDFLEYAKRSDFA